MSPDAVIVGSGPNGLTAAARLARAGWSVLVLESAATAGGGTRTASLIRPEVDHDVCSAVHPLGISSPAFARLDLEGHGLQWLHPPIPLAHPLPDGNAAVLRRSVDDTAVGLGEDGPAYRRLVEPMVRHWGKLASALLRPVVGLPSAPLAMARFGWKSLPPLSWIADRFVGPEAPALLAGIGAHSVTSLDRPLSTATALLLAVAGHGRGWPVAAGGSQAIADALAAVIEGHGGELRMSTQVESWSDIPAATAVLLDVTPRQLAAIAGPRLPASTARRARAFRYGPGVCKADYILSAPVPWQATECRAAGTVHVGGWLEDVVASESAVVGGRYPGRPFTLVVQPTVADPSRAPAGQHVLWVYSHSPAGSNADFSELMERHIERYAPGWRDLITGKYVRTAAGFESYNANNIGGDISGGSNAGRQLLFRPWPSWHPYRSGIPGVYLCSASTPPGGGVHGMCGWHSAGAAMADLSKSRRLVKS